MESQQRVPQGFAFLYLIWIAALITGCSSADPLAALERTPFPGKQSQASALPAPESFREEIGGALVLHGQICTPRPGVRVSPDAMTTGDILSPKSVNFTADGRHIYINALEGFTTLVYSFPELKREAAIRHNFTQADAPLFYGESSVFGYQYHHKPPTGDPNIFSGKPVEAAFSHNGAYLWVPYYRRDFDGNASCPSAVAVIDTQSKRIIRVMPTGPLPKVAAVSPDNTLAALTHWGDNTVGLIDISSADPAHFAYVRHLVIGSQMSTAGITGDRDRNCGACLRGTVFTPDNRTLLVGRMGGGGIAAFSMPDGVYLGTITAFCDSPRHLVIDPSGTTLYASNNRAGAVHRVSVAEALSALNAARGATVAGPKGEALSIGAGVRTIAVSPNGKYLYAVANHSAELVQVDLDSWRIVRRAAVSPYPVGLGVSPDGKYVAVTSQGNARSVGGNSVEIFRTTP